MAKAKHVVTHLGFRNVAFPESDAQEAVMNHGRLR